MAGIEMENEGVLGGNSPVSAVQQGGGGTIEMYGGDGVSFSSTPVSSVQVGGKSAGIEMTGEQGLLSKGATATFGARLPSDKGE